MIDPEPVFAPFVLECHIVARLAGHAQRATAAVDHLEAVVQVVDDDLVAVRRTPVDDARPFWAGCDQDRTLSSIP